MGQNCFNVMGVLKRNFRIGIDDFHLVNSRFTMMQFTLRIQDDIIASSSALDHLVRA